ncbi:uncharacterized protein LOC123713483 isoform X2 [Pieris brassicae]|uniref:uncharacterized protein LOC123713483 isoform X2 n=1 Tax=Pieris brassicae TaxID=7116 RepID=UPI001E65EDF2|nr:uncharacterized protein LOC123713483 isoform X2 [Pieris brassicae]
MSWMNRAQSGASQAPQPGPDQTPYNTNQAYGGQPNIYQNFQSGQNTQQQNIWPVQQEQQQQFDQQYGQIYSQSSYGNNSNEFYQQPPQFNQNYCNQNYDNVQQGYQPNFYQNTSTQQQVFNQNKPNNDTWEDNWGWGWEDASKQSQKNVSQVPVQLTKEPVYNQNANIIEESFSSNDNWNWSMENKPKEPSLKCEEKCSTPDTNQMNANALPYSQGNVNTTASLNFEQVKTLNDRDVVKEQMPNLMMGKRFNLENLTPQWSIESQMSQDSSDGPLTHSEGTHSTHRSENQSRSSNKSSPGPNIDSTTFNFSQTVHEMSDQVNELTKSIEDSVSESHYMYNANLFDNSNDLSQSMSEMHINKIEKSEAVNEEGPITEHLENTVAVNNMYASNVNQRPSPLPSPATNPQQTPLQSIPSLHSRQSPMPPAPPVTGSSQQNLNMPPRNPTNTIAVTDNVVPTQPSHPATGCLPPPPNFSSSSSNPFKHSGPFSHKTIGVTQHNSYPMPQAISSASNLVSPAAVSKLSQGRMPDGFGANLETTPDNSERPDQLPPSTYRSSITHNMPDNLEVAPQNDRNEYLQTAHLSGNDFGENNDFSRPPPPGSRRMGVGQQDLEYNQDLNISGEEPPPGLARMVPGQQTESDNTYNQASEVYMDRHIDGQPTDSINRPYRRADGQQTPDEYVQTSQNRGSDRRLVGLDRMVPGEPSNDDYSQFQNTNYSGTNEQRVVTGVDNSFPITTEVGLSEIREQNVDGSDYTEQNLTSTSRNVIGARETSNVTTPEYNMSVEDQQREITMEGENLQDLSMVSSADVSFREHTFDTSNINIGSNMESNDAGLEYIGNNSRKQSLNRSSGDSGESEGDRGYKASPRKDREKHKPSRDRDKDLKYPRDDRKYERDSERRPYPEDRRSERERRDKEKDKERARRDRDDSPESRRHRRSVHSRRYETEDTDYYSDKDRDRRRYREGSYSSKPPRPDENDRRYDDRRRYNTIERERRHEDERERRRPKDRYERRYREIDPTRRHPRRPDEDRRRVVTFSSDAKSESSKGGDTYSSGSRAGSRDATATDEDPDEPRRRPRDERRRYRTRPDPPYDEYAMSGYGGDAYAAQYEYYERLRRADPAAYMRLYHQIMAGHLQQHRYPGYELRGEERGSVHSGRSSANGLKGPDAYYGGLLRAPPTFRTDGSDREVTTDASLNLQLEESTVRSERMTPFKYSTAHIKGTLSAGTLVVVRAAWPADGRPAPVRLLPLTALLAADPMAQELAALPGPLVRGVTHKKNVIEYCMTRVRDAPRCEAARRDVTGYTLVWELLALLLRQNGVVMGSDVAELLMNNAKEYEYRVPSLTPPSGSRVASSASLNCEEEVADVQITPPLPTPAETEVVVDEKEATEKLRELLTYGSQQEALEWAMNNGLWAHALTLAAGCERRTRGAVSARFVGALSTTDPLHTLYAARAQRTPPAATCVGDVRWGDWRPHVAILLANPSTKQEQDQRTVTQFGDSLAARGLLYSAQFCYLTAGMPFAPHPLAPYATPTLTTPTAPRLSLLLADGKANKLSHFATNQAIFATEIYEYAVSLSQDYIIDNLQVYKFLIATRLAECGFVERALRYTEAVGRAALARPQSQPPALLTAVTHLADRLKYHDPAEAAGEEVADAGEGSGEGSGEPSPRHNHWIQDVRDMAHAAVIASAEASQQNTPQHQPIADPYSQQNWGDQTIQPQNYPEVQQQDPQPDYTPPAQYYQPPTSAATSAAAPAPAENEYAYTATDDFTYGGNETDYTYGGEWTRDDPYWQGDSQYQYGEQDQNGVTDQPAPTITMPGASRPVPFKNYDNDRPPSADQTDRETDTPKPVKPDSKGDKEDNKGDNKKGGWLGGILTKLSLRGPNQMILPDDKNPTIVWDAATKRWVNRDSPDDEPSAPPPPPRMAPPQPVTSTPLQSPGGIPPGASALAPGIPSAAGGNLLRMQRGRNIKKSYVDVFNPAGAPPPAVLPPPDLPPAPPAATPQYFVPAPVQQSGIYDPNSMEPERSAI